MHAIPVTVGELHIQKHLHEQPYNAHYNAHYNAYAQPAIGGTPAVVQMYNMLTTEHSVPSAFVTS
jgi:hypothetical protein